MCHLRRNPRGSHAAIGTGTTTPARGDPYSDGTLSPQLPAVHMSPQRLRTDYAFALVVLLGSIAACGILPFAAMRFAGGQTLVGLVDLAIIAGIATNVVYAWRGGNIIRAGLNSVLVCSVGAVVVAVLAGLAGALWLYPVLLANYLLVERVRAGIVSAVAVAAVALHGGAFESGLEVAMFVTTTSVSSVFAYLFAQRTDQQRRQLERLAAHDPLTGASNRLTMSRDLARAIEQAHSDGTEVGLAVLDLDHFKQINDRHGHDGGDRVLVDFVRLVTARTRRHDRLFRYGGEEFVLLLPGADGETLQRRLDTLCTSVREQLRIDGAPVTVSIGGAVRQSQEKPEQWLARADAAMYQAKRNGRDCVVVAG